VEGTNYSRRASLRIAEGAVAAACAFTFLEFLRSYEFDLWQGVPRTAWLGAGLGLFIYIAVFIVLALAVWAVFSWVTTRRRWLWPGSVGIAGILVATLLWRLGHISNVSAGILAAAAVGLAALWFGGMAIGVDSRHISLAVIAGCAAGFSMLVVAPNLFFLRVDNEAIAGIVAASAWAAIAFMVLVLVMARGAAGPPVSARIIMTFGVLVAAPWVAFAALNRNVQALANSEQPNVVFIVVDTLRAQSCSVYGGPVETPALEAAAMEGALFERFYSLSNWTPPSMAGMLYSVYPFGVSAEGLADQLKGRGLGLQSGPADATLASMLAARGYATGAFIGNVLLATNRMQAGIAHSRVYRHAAIPVTPLFSRLPFLESAAVANVPRLRYRRQIDMTAALTDDAVRFMNRNADRPFMLWVHYMDPHAPYDPPERFRTMDGPWPWYVPHRAGIRSFVPPDEQLDARDRDYVSSLYEGEVRYIDEQFGRVMAEIDRLGLRDSTYVCIVSDHGEELWEHGQRGHGLSLFNDQIHVPFILLGPDIAPQRIDRTTAMVDVTPTLAELVGMDRHESWRGNSLAPLVRGEETPMDDGPLAFASGMLTKGTGEVAEAVIDWPYKLVRGTQTENVYLYNMAEDPEETNDLSGDMPGVRDRLAKELDAWRSQVKSASGESVSPKEAQEQIEKLEALGYI